MQDDVTENLKNYLQRLTPLLFSIFLVLLSYVPFDFPAGSNIRPAVGMVCVYYWMIHRPDLFNLLSVYILGLIEDIVSSVPLGANIFTLLVLYILLNNLARFFNAKPFIITWYGFAILSFIAFFAKWLMVSIYYGQFLPVWVVLFSYLVSIAAYPVLSLMNAFVQNYLIQDEV